MNFHSGFQFISFHFQSGFGLELELVLRLGDNFPLGLLFENLQKGLNFNFIKIFKKQYEHEQVFLQVFSQVFFKEFAYFLG